MHNLKINLEPSGLNNHFYGKDLSFSDYIQLMRSIIIQSRKDLNTLHADSIVRANSPFSWSKDKNLPYKNGVLLVHGLFDSPFYLQDIGNYFLKRNFLVRAILLPGHGSVPGDLLSIEAEEWTKAVAYGLKTLARDVENVFITGYSLGGALSIHEAITNSNLNIKALFLFAPAIKTRSLINRMLAKYHYIFSWTSPQAKWFQIREPSSFVKYYSLALNAGYQACRIIEATQSLIQDKKFNFPTFTALSEDDETISPKAIFKFFSQLQDTKSRILLYSNSSVDHGDKRIIKRSSHFPEHRILDFSHTCLTISPENSLFGIESKYQDLAHYRKIPINKGEFYQGALSKKNLKKFPLQRLSYNPDFTKLLDAMDDFLGQVLS